LKVKSIVKEIQSCQKNWKESVERKQDYQNWHLNTEQWEKEIEVVPERYGKTNS
jgi:hypothetical protein